MISRFILALKTNESLYLRLPFYILLISVFLYIRATHKKYDSMEKQREGVVFAGKMVIASIALMIISFLTTIESRILALILSIIVLIVEMLLIEKIKSLPIWEEEEEEEW